MLVKGVGSGTGAKDGVNIGNGGLFKLLTRQNHLGRYGQENSHALSVEKEEQLIFLDRATHRTGPLIRISERPRRPQRVIEPIVRV